MDIKDQIKQLIVRFVRVSKLSVFMLMAVILVGCASNYELSTATGKPEIIIHNVSRKDINDTIVNMMLTDGFELQKQNDYQLVFGKKDNSVGMMLLAGSSYDATPEWRYTYNMVDFADGIRIIGNIGLITNPGSAFEKSVDLSKNSKHAQGLHRYLISLKNNLELKTNLKARGKVGIKSEKNVITEVVPGSPADQAGLVKGDFILKIDGVRYSTNEYDNAMRITGEPGTTVKFTLLRDSGTVEIDVVRGQP